MHPIAFGVIAEMVNIEQRINVLFLKIDEGLGWCWQREKIDWQEPRKFDCRFKQLSKITS